MKRIYLIARFPAASPISSLLLAAIACGAVPNAIADADEVANVPIEASAAELEATFVRKLAGLASICDEQKLPEQAQITRQWRHRDPRRQYIYLPRLGKSEAEPTQPLPKKWYRTWKKARGDYAESLFAVAKRAVVSGKADMAYRMLNEVVREDPNHQAARKILGHRKVGNSWQAGPQKTSVRRPRQRHPRLGWQAGKYWRIESPRFRIVTNDTRDAGVKLAEKLERFEVVWRQLFFEYWNDAATLRAAFDGNTRARTRARYQIVLFRNRDEYTKYLSSSEPQIAMTLGYYGKQPRTSFFFSGDESIQATWLHETTHQLFHESRRGSLRAGEAQNFWIMEGIALYIESMREYDGFVTLGGIDAERLQFARYRALQQDFYMPLEQLSTLGREQMQAAPQIRELYSQAAGLTHYLMDYKQGEYRRNFIRFVHDVHRSTDEADSLASRIGKPNHELDAEYRQFLDVTDDNLASLPKTPAIRKLVVGNTSVSARGISAIDDLSQLDWLDATNTPINDATVQSLANNQVITQLSLEGTKITNESLKLIGQLKTLDELDLSNTAITDAGLANLSKLPRLSILWLTGTRVSDEGLRHLARLKHLSQIDVSNTRVTADGLQRLRNALPNLSD